MSVGLCEGQRSLFGHEPPAIGPLGPVLERRHLGAGAWIDHAAAWLDGHEVVFEALLDEVDWQHHRRPMYDRIVDVPRLIGEVPTHGIGAQVSASIQQRLCEYYRTPFERTSVALYRDGADSVAWHGDQVARDLTEALVATVSLGAPRTFALRPRGEGQRHNLRLGHGDVVVMGGTCQRTWEHAVPKVRWAAPRIVMMFRPASSSRAPSWTPGA